MSDSIKITLIIVGFLSVSLLGLIAYNQYQTQQVMGLFGGF